MVINGLIIGKELALACIGLTLFGLLYNYAIEKWPFLAHRRPAEQVTAGVLITIFTSGFVIGLPHMLLMLVLFMASGTPMIIGSWIRAARDDAEAKRIQKETLTK